MKTVIIVNLTKGTTTVEVSDDAVIQDVVSDIPESLSVHTDGQDARSVDPRTPVKDGQRFTTQTRSLKNG